MRRALRAVYGRLLMIPAVGPLFRIPVLMWRALRGTQTGAGLAPTVRTDTLALTVAALDAVRDEQAREAEKQALLEAAVSGLRDEQARQAEKQALVETAVSGLRDDVSAIAPLVNETRALARQLAERPAVHPHLLDTQIAALENRLRERIEFARAETMFELRAHLPRGGTPAVPGRIDAAPVEKRVINQARVAAQRAAGSLRLNLGCGHVLIAGYVNIDMRDLPGVDAVAEVTDLPFETGSVAEIHSAHLLEHFPLEHLRRVVLPYWRRLLRPGGQLRAVVPDAEAMLQDYACGEMSFDDLREVTYGLQEYEGDFHFNMFSREALAQLLRNSGFDEVGFPFQGRKNGKCRDMEIRGIRA